MDMFFKMYNVKTFPVREGTQTLLQAHVFYFKAQSVRTRSKWLRQSVVVWTPHVCSQKVIRQTKMCQILCWSSTVSEARWNSVQRGGGRSVSCMDSTSRAGLVVATGAAQQGEDGLLHTFVSALFFPTEHEANVIDKSSHVVFSPNRHFQCWYDCFSPQPPVGPLCRESLVALKTVDGRLEGKMTFLTWASELCHMIQHAPNSQQVHPPYLFCLLHLPQSAF